MPPLRAPPRRGKGAPGANHPGCIGAASLSRLGRTTKGTRRSCVQHGEHYVRTLNINVRSREGDVRFVLHTLGEYPVHVLREETVGLLARVVPKVVHRMIWVVALVFDAAPVSFEAMLGGGVPEPAITHAHRP
jgi:hypothetical protein